MRIHKQKTFSYLPLFVVVLLLASTMAKAQETVDSETGATLESENTEVTTRETTSESPTDASENTTSTKDKTNDGSAVFDVDQLVERMKETDAIGFITKLSLKNQVDDLLESAEKIRQSTVNQAAKIAKLQESFDGLILKTVTLLNKGEDYTLAEDIYSAKDQLWKSIMEHKA